MAPAAFMYGKNTIRVFIGCWDSDKISRIGYIDLDASDPKKILYISQNPVLDIGRDGCFDDNGVFPGHVYKNDRKIYLYYTGFQKLHKIAFSNFGGLAISEDGGNSFKRISESPVMDRADEGLFTRAGNSVIYEDGLYKSCYSVGSAWRKISGKNRPIYDVNYIESADGINFDKVGKKIIECDLAVEHGLGRPQITKIGKKYCIFYTRRMLNLKYHIGCAVSENCDNWQRIDSWMGAINHGSFGEFDSEMVYFPCVVNTGKKIYLFYSGNGYGADGIGYAELT